MSSMSSVAGLSKYIKTLPKTKYNILGILILSFLIGSAYFLIDLTPSSSVLEDIILGGLFGLMVLGTATIMSGALNQQVISSLHGINLKIKHSMFLSGLSMPMLGIMVLIGCVISRIINIDIFINSALFALVLIYGFNTLVFWATSKVRFAVAAITGLIQPVLIM
ncbi:MAG: DUF2070 family protein, partial [Methanobrevibacter sp.]|nr:DUF2070 family protein [Methanobrevibacter sp.]